MTTPAGLPDPNSMTTAELLDIDVDLRSLRGDLEYRGWLLDIVGELCRRGVSKTRAGARS